LKVLISFAIYVGNPLFGDIPKVIRQSKLEHQQELVEHLVHASSLEFSEETGLWMQDNYGRIDYGTFYLCKAFKWGSVKPEYQ
jgi:hypothetical protein